MPDWYVRRNDKGAAFPYQIRLGGCEYSLTEAEWEMLASGVGLVFEHDADYCESEGYHDLTIAKGDDKKSLSSIMGFDKPVEPMKRRI
jgi:hypothetical protein